MDNLSVDLSVGLSVGLSASALWKNGGSDPDAVWRRRSDGSRDEAGGGVWRSVHGKGYFWGQILGAPRSTAAYWTYVCYSAVTRHSCQITLGRLVQRSLGVLGSYFRVQSSYQKNLKP